MSTQVNIARIKDGIVVNIEIADAEWMAANLGADGFTFIAYGSEDHPHIGHGWNQVDGFEQLAIEDAI